jgi:hypothetical protein
MALTKNDLKEIRQRKYLAKDFDGLRALLVEYARLYYPDKLSDFSEAGIGGLFLDLAAYVGDNLSFYLDHQFGELDIDTAVELRNIERELRSSGVKISGAAPSSVYVLFFLKVPATLMGSNRVPMEEALPTLKAGSVAFGSGIRFELLEDVDFAARDDDGVLLAQYRTGDIDKDGSPKTFIIAKAGLCLSGRVTTDSFTIDGDFIAFRELTLANPDVSEIISVVDGFGNVYYEVQSHTSDVVYVNTSNVSIDSKYVADTIKIIPAPYRYVRNVDLGTRTARIILGGGNADTLEDDVIPDPSEFAIPFVYRKTFSRVAINPEQLLQTKTLGVYALNTSISVTYRYGGGLNHNVEANTIRDIPQLILDFPLNPTVSIQTAVRQSIECTNEKRALGGEDSPTIDDLKTLIPSMRNMQERIVSRQDLLARVYTLPSNFGRVFRAAIHSSPNNPLASQLFIISRDANSRLMISPDTLKENLVKYLNPYRMISDAIEILDARRINLQVKFEVLTDVTLNKNIVLQNILKKLIQLFDIKNYNIDQPIILSDVNSAIFSTDGVVSVNELVINNLYGIVNNREYSDVSFDVPASTVKGIIIPPAGGIFEVRYLENDIIGKAV